MTVRPVIIELSHSSPMASSMALDAGPSIDGVTIDPSFAPVQIPRVEERSVFDTDEVSRGSRFRVDMEPQASTYIVRGTVEEKEIERIAARPDVVQVYADVQIEPFLICPGAPPKGNATDVANNLCVSKLKAAGANGAGVRVAIVDTGINSAHLNAKGVAHALDAGASWAPAGGPQPGKAAVGHGTMCAYDVLIAAPQATLIDVALLASKQQGFLAFLSDAVAAYNHLLSLMNGIVFPGANRSLVVNNSWGMFHPSWDLPVGHPGNYSDNPNHPFNKIVATLEAAGADILFAAGNCGSDCPDGRCQGVTQNVIYGANSHPAVLSVAGVDIGKTRVGYSSKGPGRLTKQKPDIAGYTHFAGSGVYAADGGTSAACPVVAGVVAAIRSKRPYVAGNATRSPAAIRTLVRSTAQDLGAAGYDYDHGYGVVDGCAIAAKLQPVIPGPFPGPFPGPIDLCKKYPHLCGIKLPPVPKPWPIPVPVPVPPIPRPGPQLEFGAEGADGPPESVFDTVAALQGEELAQALDIVWRAGYAAAREPAESRSHDRSGPCNC